MNSADVVVVGGGPAGATTALLLARAGHDVLLLERHAFPRAKPCGDCISPGANAILQRLGVWDDVVRAGAAMLKGWRLTAASGTGFSVAFADMTGPAVHGLAIRRDRFDEILLDHARAAGVRVHHHAYVQDVVRDPAGAVQGVRVRVDSDTRVVSARMTIGADGLRSVVARRLHAYARSPRLRKTSFTVHAHLPERREVGEMRLGAQSCLGIAPIDAHGTLHNVTLVLQAGSFDARMGAPRIAAEGLARFGIPIDVGDKQILTSGPFDWPVRATTFDGAALVGDAAGYYDPFTGQGIYQALAGGEMLAEHVTAALARGKVTRGSLAGYEHANRQMRASTRRLQQIIDFVCAHPALADFAFRRCARNRPAARELLGATSDLLSADRLFSAGFLMRLFG